MAQSTSSGTSGNSPDATGPAVTPEVSGPTTTGPDSSGSGGSSGTVGLPPGERDN
jgi:hypothetical protein